MNIQRLLRFLWYVCLDHLQIGRNYPIPNLPDKSLLCNFKNSLHKLSLVSDLEKRSCLVRSFCTDCTLGPQLVILLTKPKFHSINRIGLCLTLWMQPSNRAKTCCLAQQQTPLANIFSYWFHCGAAKGCANIARSLLGEGLVVACLRRSARMKRVHWILQNFELWEQAPLAHCTENHHHFYNLFAICFVASRCLHCGILQSQLSLSLSKVRFEIRPCLLVSVRLEAPSFTFVKKHAHVKHQSGGIISGDQNGWLLRRSRTLQMGLHCLIIRSHVQQNSVPFWSTMAKSGADGCFCRREQMACRCERTCQQQQWHCWWFWHPLPTWKQPKGSNGCRELQRQPLEWWIFMHRSCW